MGDREYGNGRDNRNGDEPPKLFRAAEYVRMSTEHQLYSTEKQADKIREYASQRRVEIVRTYADAGKSVLRIDGRLSLQPQLQDVESGTADFTIILVYDASRWGHFQDADESAYYEHRCRRAGIQVAPRKLSNQWHKCRMSWERRTKSFREEPNSIAMN